MLATVFLALALATSGARALYSEGGDVRVLHPGNFKGVVAQPALVEFYAPW